MSTVKSFWWPWRHKPGNTYCAVLRSSILLFLSVAAYGKCECSETVKIVIEGFTVYFIIVFIMLIDKPNFNSVSFFFILFQILVMFLGGFHMCNVILLKWKIYSQVNVSMFDFALSCEKSCSCSLKARHWQTLIYFYAKYKSNIKYTRTVMLLYIAWYLWYVLRWDLVFILCVTACEVSFSSVHVSSFVYFSLMVLIKWSVKASNNSDFFQMWIWNITLSVAWKNKIIGSLPWYKKARVKIIYCYWH